MEQFAFLAAPASSVLTLKPGHYRTTSPLHPARHARACSPLRKRLRAQIVCRAEFDPVEDGVTLPAAANATALEAERRWLSDQLTAWLDAEWQQGVVQPIHRRIGDRTAQIYARHRMEGQDDLSSVLVAIGSELEGMDFSAAFVGPWNVANKACELLLERHTGRKVRMAPRGAAREGKVARGGGDATDGREEMREDKETGARREVASVNLADRFERMKFLRDVIDGSISKEMVDGAVAVAMGFRYDEGRGGWDGAGVEDEHFRRFGDEPPDVLGDEGCGARTDTLDYLEKQLGIEEDESGKLEEGLNLVIETLHGADLTKIQTKDEADFAFHKRVIVAKWLHLKGGF